MKIYRLHLRMLALTSMMFLFNGVLMLHAEDVENNVLPNGDFEEWEHSSIKGMGDRQGKEWQPPTLSDGLAPKNFELICEKAGDPPGVTIARDELEKHSGSYSIRVENADASQIASIFAKDFPVNPLSRYKVTVWYKMSEVSGKGSVMVWTYYGPKKGGGKRHEESRSINPSRGNSDWLKCEFTMDTTEDSELGSIGLQLRAASGTVWFDDVSVARVGEIKSIPNF